MKVLKSKLMQKIQSDSRNSRELTGIEIKNGVKQFYVDGVLQSFDVKIVPRLNLPS